MLHRAATQPRGFKEADAVVMLMDPDDDENSPRKANRHRRRRRPRAKGGRDAAAGAAAAEDDDDDARAPHRRRRGPAQHRSHELLLQGGLDTASPAAASTPSSASDAASPGLLASPADSHLSRSGGSAVVMLSGTPETSPMQPRDRRHDDSLDLGQRAGKKMASPVRRRRSDMELTDYISEDEERSYGNPSDDDDISDGALSIQGDGPEELLDRLRDMGFRETVARAATDQCTNVSVAVQYATDYQMRREVCPPPAYASKTDDHASASSSSSSFSFRSASAAASARPRGARRRQHRPATDAESIRSWKPAATSPAAAAAAAAVGTPVQESRRQELARHLRAIGFSHADIRSAVLRCSSTPAAARFIIDGGVAGWERKTASALFQCDICFDDELPEDRMVTLGCNHRFCRDCLQVHIAGLIDTHKVVEEDFVCPDAECVRPLELPIVQDLLSDSDFERLLDLKLRKQYAEAHEEVRTCPKCSTLVVIEDVEQNADLLDKLTCINPDCRHTFCGRCGLAPHIKQEELDVSCADYAAFLEANDSSAASFEAYMRENNMKRCPKCFVPAELKSGCHFIRCVCKCSYCYLCGRALEEHMHYSHYHKGPYGKRCYGGAKDKKGFVAEPACAKCKGPGCQACEKACDADTRGRLERMARKHARRERGKTQGVLGWLRRRYRRQGRK